jgi:hypothetical protein
MKLVYRAPGDQDMARAYKAALNQSLGNGHTQVSTANDSDFIDHILNIVVG